MNYVKQANAMCVCVCSKLIEDPNHEHMRSETESIKYYLMNKDPKTALTP